MDSFFGFFHNLGFRRGPWRLLGGIGGGIADATGAPLTLVRILLLVAFLLPGIGAGLYVVAWILLPWQDGSIPLERLLRGNSSGPGHTTVRG